jgi:tetratricopeptide (TPR) repeat protein
MSIDSGIARAIALRDAGQHTAALAILLDLADANRGHATLHYQIASCYDLEGLESDAITHYEVALALGLAGDELRGALLGLGSAYRCVEQYADAVRTLERGIEMFPDAAEFSVFLALALHNLGEHRRAMTLLIAHIAEFSADPVTAKHRRALFHYAQQPDAPYDD